jgi:hypothetical protein
MLASTDDVCYALQELLLDRARHLSGFDEKLFLNTSK